MTSHCRHERRRTARMLLRARRAAQGINAFRGKVGSQQGLKMSRKGRECVKWSEKWEPLGRKGWEGHYPGEEFGQVKFLLIST